MHEHSQKHTAKIKGSSDRTFGLVFTVFFVLVAAYPLINGQQVRVWSLLVAGLFLLLALLYPRILAPANRAWMKLGTLLHHIVSPLALGILFFLVVTPTALLMRLFGKDPLRLRFDNAVDSYWIKRDPPGPAPDSLNNQF
jgi:hypothetical protein